MTAVLIISIVSAPLGNISLAAKKTEESTAKVEEKVLQKDKNKKIEIKDEEYQKLLQRKKELEKKKTLTNDEKLELKNITDKLKNIEEKQKTKKEDTKKKNRRERSRKKHND